MTIPFYICATVALISTVRVITGMNAVHALLNFIVSLLAVGMIFVLLGAPFAAVLVVIVNAGAIMVLFVFVIMMLNPGPKTVERNKWWLRPRLWAGPAGLTTILVIELAHALIASPASNSPIRVVTAREVGVSLFGPYLLAVELASFLLLSSLIGTYHLGREDPGDGKGREPR
jgi:NADH-quinone oxidoreductase subunit J